MGSGRTGSSPNKAGSRVPTEQSRGMRRSSGNTGRLAFHGAPGDRDRPRVGRNASGGAASGEREGGPGTPPSQLVWVRGARVREQLLGTRRCKALLTGGFPRRPCDTATVTAGRAGDAGVDAACGVQGPRACLGEAGTRASGVSKHGVGGEGQWGKSTPEVASGEKNQ